MEQKISLYEKLISLVSENNTSSDHKYEPFLGSGSVTYLSEKVLQEMRFIRLLSEKNNKPSIQKELF